MIHNPKIECMGREEMRELQGERLKKIVRLCYDKVSFYRNKMDKKAIIAKYGKNEADTGSPEVQVALVLEVDAVVIIVKQFLGQ